MNMPRDPQSATARRYAARRRPPRASRACETCRGRKTKCDQAQPCSYCSYHSLDCFYRGTTQRTPLARRQQKHKGRPSPWPEINDTRASPGSPGVLGNNAQVQVPSRSPSAPGTPGPNTLVVSPELGDSASRDGLSGVNLHTKGTEFYGNSSNLAFLGNLYMRARTQADSRVPDADAQHVSASSPRIIMGNPQSDIAPDTPQSDAQSDRRARAGPHKAQLSIVNLLYNPSYPDHSQDQRGGNDEEGSRRKESQRGAPRSFAGHDRTIATTAEWLAPEAQLEIEKLFIGSYFSNKHYIHPMLNKAAFMHRCEKDAFDLRRRPGFMRGSSRFSGLYFAVVALGAINASSEETSLLDHYCTNSTAERQEAESASQPSALDFADFYFKTAKQAIGDLFEGCCLESVQALLLMSIFCQNALRPHSCFMYSGMAVRTAVAIGLASGMSSLPPGMRKEARRTWWCIYSHEIEMCCSSGRLDSMKELCHYQVPLPTLKASPGSQLDPDAEDNDVAMIPVMVALAQIMSAASHQLYHSPKRSLDDMSRIAMDLDRKLLDWKAGIPKFLDIDVASLNDPEWAFKQKLVLRLRFYNTRILIHRPFLAAVTSNVSSPALQQHLHICLETARTNIHMQYESFLHRLYIRTWWYNTTYALYGAMILLHVVLAGSPCGPPDSALLHDVEKSLDIFESMNNIVVARRCAEMIREVLEVARACVVRRSSVDTMHDESSSNTLPLERPQSLRYTGMPGTQFVVGSSLDRGNNSTLGLEGSGGIDSATGFTLPGDTPATEGGSFFYSLFNDQGAQPDTRAEILANLVDPTVLEDFAFGSGLGGELSFL